MEWLVVELLPFPVLLGRRGCTFLQTCLSRNRNGSATVTYPPGPGQT